MDVRSPSKRLWVVDGLWNMVETWRKDLWYMECEDGDLACRCLGGVSIDGFFGQLHKSCWGGWALTDPIAYPCHFSEVSETVIEAILGSELLQLNHDLQSLRVTLNVQEHQLGAKRSHRADPS
jgi:hypothetical protein